MRALESYEAVAYLVALGCHTSPISLHFTIILRFSNNMTLLDMHKYREVPR